MVTIEEYFNSMIYPRHPELGYFMESGKVVCPFHDDINPSLGIIPGSSTWHCFGCGLAGDVVEMHRRYLRDYHGKSLSRWQAEKDLYEAFDREQPSLSTPQIIKAKRLSVPAFSRKLTKDVNQWTHLLKQL